MNYENVKEKILTLNYYLLTALDEGDKIKIDKIRRRIDHYITMAITLKSIEKEELKKWKG